MRKKSETSSSLSKQENHFDPETVFDLLISALKIQAKNIVVQVGGRLFVRIEVQKVIDPKSK